MPKARLHAPALHGEQPARKQVEEKPAPQEDKSELERDQNRRLGALRRGRAGGALAHRRKVCRRAACTSNPRVRGPTKGALGSCGCRLPAPAAHRCGGPARNNVRWGGRCLRRPVAGAKQERAAARAVRGFRAHRARISRAVRARALGRRGWKLPPNKRALLRGCKRGVAAHLHGLDAHPSRGECACIRNHVGKA